MKEFLFTWLYMSAILGGILLTVGCAVAALAKGPVRRLRLLEWTLLAALGAPVLASTPLPWRWSISWSSAEPATTIRAPSAASGAISRMGMSTEASSLPNDSIVAQESARSDPSRSREVVRGIKWDDALLTVQGTAGLLFAGWWLVGAVSLGWLWSNARAVSCRNEHEIEGIEVRSHPRVPTPCAFGLRRWRILVPGTMADCPQGEALSFALAHESAHLRRGDLWTWRLTRFAQVALWFQPAYWWLRRQVRLCQDYLADADAAQRGGTVEFATFLLDSARTHHPVVCGAALPLSGQGSDLSRRISMLLKPHAPFERRCARSVQWVTGFAVATVLGAAALVRLDAQDTPLSLESPASDLPGSEQGITYNCRVVTYGTEAPIAGAKVTVRRMLSGDPRYPIPGGELLETTEHTTASDGSYSFRIRPEQAAERYLYLEYDVSHPEHAEKNGFGYALGMIRRNEQIGGRPFFETTKLHPSVRVTGSLLTPSGEPARGVRVHGYTYPAGDRFANEDLRGSFFESMTDGSGRFSVAIATPGSGAFWFQPNDAAPMGVVAPDGRGDIGTLQLKAGVRKRGRVLDAEGVPVASVTIRVSRTGSESTAIDEFNRTSVASGGYVRKSVTDTEGWFELAPVDPGQYAIRIDESLSSPGQYAGVFPFYAIAIADDAQDLEFRAFPKVAVRVQNVDADGHPKRGFEFSVTGYFRDGFSDGFATMSDRPQDGLCTAFVPKGMTNVHIQFMDNEHGSFRVRRSPGAEPEAIREIRLDQLDADLDGIEVIRYRAPILLLRAVDSQGNTIPDIKPVLRYTVIPWIDGALEPRFEKQEDGRWRSISLLPDAEVAVSAMKDGWWSEDQNVVLAEGEEKEVVILMRRLSVFAKGERIYAIYCSVCHHSNGQGIRALSPPLAGSEWVNAEGPNRLIRRLLDGFQGPIGVEPPWRDLLKDEELAAVLSYVRGNADWGNTANAVTPEQVKAVRDLTAGRATAWSPDELLQIAPTD